MALIGAGPAPAHAYVPSAAFGAVIGCTSEIAPKTPAGSAGFEASKGSAILGGRPSALDLISAQQTSDTEGGVSRADEQVQLAGNPQIFLCPWGTLAPVSVPQDEEPRPASTVGSDAFLGSTRVSIGITPLDRAWRRVSSRNLDAPFAGYVAKQAQGSDLEHLERVNAWVNRKIAFVEDKTLYGQADYWATASETLRLLKGDCEDFAILKYQILVDSGIDPDSIFLTLVWDKIRRRDHAVLIVRLEGSHYLLDSDFDQVLPADMSYEYSARMSFNQQSAWLHGYTAKVENAQTLDNRRFAYFSDSAVSNALDTGFIR
ncbi:MAG: transglutaminase-like cysteine peptidase [Erythrobacter sp.]|jgi:predicted transglutaminase-like cysteine proteinase|nr:transglutaminase-like cysteine peptidase [Erythrobacter sp.]